MHTWASARDPVQAVRSLDSPDREGASVRAVRRALFWIALLAVVALVVLGHYLASFLLLVIVALPPAFGRLARYQRSLDLGRPDPGAQFGANHYRP